MSKLQSVSSWRGRLVDSLLTQELVPALTRRTDIRKSQLLRSARARFDRELDFAFKHRMREPGIAINDQPAFAAFRAIEYGEKVTSEEIEQAWADIELAVRNLFDLPIVRAKLKQASYVIAQRSLQFDHGGVTVVAVPDAVAFYENDAPLIIDWKVQANGTRDYRLQLTLYALALLSCKPHKDFPARLSNYRPQDLVLLEAQLVSGKEHLYTLTSADVEELEDFISATSTEMLSATAGLKVEDLTPEDFSVTMQPDLCGRCSFKRVCWETVP